MCDAVLPLSLAQLQLQLSELNDATTQHNTPHTNTPVELVEGHASCVGQKQPADCGTHEPKDGRQVEACANVHVAKHNVGDDGTKLLLLQ